MSHIHAICVDLAKFQRTLVLFMHFHFCSVELFLRKVRVRCVLTTTGQKMLAEQLCAVATEL